MEPNELADVRFEKAVDAVVSGDVETLQALLREDGDLIRRRSKLEHEATLLIYVGANGVEAYRQVVPPNAVVVATVLLDAGAEVDAWGRMYRGTTTLGLVATSVHPVKAELQEPLMELLVARGADVNHAVAPDYTDGNLILACLHNGRCEPVRWLAQHGAEVDLEGAGGVGELERVRKYFTEEGRLTDERLAEKSHGCLIWASACGHMEIVQFLLDAGIEVGVVWDQTTALHSAAYGGHVGIVRLLLERGAPTEVLNYHGGTVLGTAIWSWYNARKPGHRKIVEMLVDAGAAVRDDLKGYVDEIRDASA